MTSHPYWRKQASDQPLFPDFIWNKPERRDQAGKLAIIGGNKLGFSSVANAYGVAQQAGIGEARILLPDNLKKIVPSAMTEAIFAASNPSGGLARQALDEMVALGDWADGVLLIGDAGRNSETALVYSNFIEQYHGQLTLTRDAIDLTKQDAQTLADRPKTLLVMSFAQTQKLLQTLYYPIVLTFNMQLTRLVEALHKFTITYPVTIMTFHSATLVIAHEGDVITQEWPDPTVIWRGDTATKAASYLLWGSAKPLEAIAISL